ncbi:MAG: serine/threonine-protein kinase [Polyangiaceae bacterium]|jgi:serine/threonine-protein kinase
MSEPRNAASEHDEVSGVSVMSRAEESQPVAPTLQCRRDPPRSGPVSSPPPSSARCSLVAGNVIGGRYRLERKIGSGGMGEVWAGEHLSLQMSVAIKVLLPRALEVPEIVARFEREAHLLGRLRSDHAQRAVDFFVDEAYGPVLVTELIAGQSLAEAIETPFSVEEAIALGIQLATAVDEVHRARVVHRDLKPSNVILRPTGAGGTHATIIDFGVGRFVDEPVCATAVEITTGDAVVGTIEYMAPEQIVPCGALTPGVDLYAVGAILFRAVAGAHVFGAGLDKLDIIRAKLANEAPRLPTGRDDALARGLATVVARALERRPAARHPSALELRAELLRLTTPAAPEPMKRGRGATSRGIRRRVLAALAAGIIGSCP